MNVFFVSLGCDKNLVDSEKMLGLLREAGYTFTDDEYEAEVIIVNTCCFIGDAKEESIQTLIDMGKHKEDGRCLVLIAAGCLAQRYREEIRTELPEVDGILGTASYDAIADVVRSALEEGKSERFLDVNRPVCVRENRLVTTGGHYAFLKIAEGCDKRCSYCVIPKVRGCYRSVPLEELEREARFLADAGVRELILVAQETTLYGMDLYGEKKLPELLKRLAAIDGIRWIRLQYCYPEEITEELIETIRTEKKVCHYLDMPVQHINDRILKRMGRKTGKKELMAQIERLRRAVPDMVLRTTLLTGFPGETEEEFEELCGFVKEARFERLGVFAYSREEDTPAAMMPDQIPEEIKQERRNILMELQQEVSLERSREKIGQVLEAFVEGNVADENVCVARTYMDAPNVDGYFFLHTERELMTGQFVRARVTGAMDYDLIGELEDEFTE
ncbi:MAG: 30S ribosomal protein S12 methylthiotransferase RimO [Lachnospiraceae bacterium]|nr:30S ribosomal protein S12 methylthiotransferase RimO [Lachnospiraceae bacterium]